MAPILIDETGIKRLGSIVLVGLVLAFIAGYLIGNQQTGFVSEADTEVPQVVTTDTTAATDQKNLDKDAQLKNAPAVKASIAKTPETRAVAKQKTDRSDKEKASREAVTDDVVAKKQQQKSRDNKVAAESTARSDTKSEEQETDGNHIKYSIQTAVYGHLSRAEKNMNELLAKNIEAYVTDYINKSNKVWYNVRFGYFRDKQSALAALDDFKQVHGGDGYLVNFSAERIVDFDEQKYYEDSMEMKPGSVSVSESQAAKASGALVSEADSSQDQAAEELSVSNNDAQLR